MGGRRTSAVHSLAIGLVVCGIFWLVAHSGTSRVVTTVSSQPWNLLIGGEVVYVDTANGPLRVWPEVHPGTACCGDRSPIQPLHLVSTVVGDCHRKTNMMC